MTLLMQKTRRRRAGFTLVELLVVMAIIALMISLLLSGVQRVRVAARRTLATTEIYELGQGVGMFKQKFNVDYIPSRIVLREDGAYVFNGPDPAQNQLERDSINWLKTAWPFLTFPIDWNQNNNLDTTPVTLEGDQCLVFFLGGMNQGGQPVGFSVNKRNPMDPSTTERIPPFIQFQVERLVARPTNASGQLGFRSYLDPWKEQPYAYFTSYGKQKGYLPYKDASNQPISDCNTLQTVPTQVYPYMDPATAKAKNADGFQILCAGEDKIFGPGAGNLPATGVGEDDLSNFSQGVLGSAN